MLEAVILILSAKPRHLIAMGLAGPVLLILWVELARLLLEPFSVILVAVLIALSWGTALVLYTAETCLRALQADVRTSALKAADQNGRAGIEHVRPAPRTLQSFASPPESAAFDDGRGEGIRLPLRG